MIALFITEGLMKFGEKLKLYRKRHSLTQKELASKLKTSQCAINLYENDKRKPNAATVARICRLLRLNPYELADLISSVPSVKETNAPYYSTGSHRSYPFQRSIYERHTEHTVARAIDVMELYLADDEKLFVADVIYELARRKGIDKISL